MHSNYQAQNLKRSIRLDTGIQKRIPGYPASIWFQCIMETCYVRILKASMKFSTEEVLMRSQAQNQSQYNKVTGCKMWKVSIRSKTTVRNLTREINSRLATTKATNLSISRDPNLTKAADTSTTWDIKAKVRFKVKECNTPRYTLEWYYQCNGDWNSSWRWIKLSNRGQVYDPYTSQFPTETKQCIYQHCYQSEPWWVDTNDKWPSQITKSTQIGNISVEQ